MKVIPFLVMYIIGMILGPLLDGMHVHSGVLTYNDPEKLQAAWVPFLFGGATLGIYILTLLIEKLFKVKSFVSDHKSTISAIVIFAIVYAFSAYSHLPSWIIFLAITVVAATLGLRFIKNKAALTTAIIVMLIGPLVEITIISQGLFNYTNPDKWGIPLWLYPLYFCAAITVGLVIQSVEKLKFRS